MENVLAGEEQRQIAALVAAIAVADIPSIVKMQGALFPFDNGVVAIRPLPEGGWEIALRWGAPDKQNWRFVTIAPCRGQAVIRDGDGEGDGTRVVMRVKI